MKDTQSPPLVHLGLLSGITLLFAIGGQITFGDWGSVPVRRVALYALVATLLHASSSYLGRGKLAVRGATWLVVLAAPLDLAPLLRPEVLVTVAAVAAVDLAIARQEVSVDLDVDPGTGGKIVAALASLAAIVLVGVLLPLAQDALVLTRLATVILVGWALVGVLAMRPALRTPLTLLGAAGALSLAFLLLAAPVLPFGPLLAYWTAILSVSAAVLTASFTRSDDPVAPEHRRHEQTVRPLPDPVLAPLAERIRRFIETGQGGQALSIRIEAALDRDEDGRLLPALCEARATGERPTRLDRRAALARLLDVDPDRLDGDTV